jgi:diketogulonate reductase-like aldo/keto reductase
VTPKRIRENFEIFDFELSKAEMKIIEGLNQNRRLGEDLSHIM